MVGKEEIDEWLKKIEEEERQEAEAAASKRKKSRDFVEIFRDDHILVVDKRSGISVIPERDPTAPSLSVELTERYGRVWTVHRIDKGTSGLVVFALTDEAHRLLNQAFQERKVEKEYLVIAVGEALEDTFDVDIPLGRASGNRMKPSAAGKESFTRFEVEERYRGYTLLRAYPRSGRQHQIRVHASAIGLPLLVDDLYTEQSAFFLSTIKRSYRDYGREERPLIDRLTLHAHRLGFDHPATGEAVTFEAEPPKDFRAVVNQLRKVRPSDV